MTQRMKVKAKFDNWLNLDQPTKSLANFFMSDAGLYMYGHYQYTPAVKAGFEYTKQVSQDAVQIILSGEAAEAGESGNNLSLYLYKDASKITIQLFNSDTLVFKNEKSYAEYDDPISAYDINNATNALDPETKGIDFFELSGNMPLADISDNPSEPTKFDFTGGRDAVDDGIDGIKASILQNHRTFTLTENDDAEYISLWVPYTSTAITDDVDVVSNTCSIPDVASTLTQATSNLYLGKYTYQETGGGSGSGSGSDSGDTSVKAHGQTAGIVIEAADVGTTSNGNSVDFFVSGEDTMLITICEGTSGFGHILFKTTLSANMENAVTASQLNALQGEDWTFDGAGNYEGHSISEYVTFSGSINRGWDLDEKSIQLSGGDVSSKARGALSGTIYVEAATAGVNGNNWRVELYADSGIAVKIYDNSDKTLVFSSFISTPSSEDGYYVNAATLNALEEDDDDPAQISQFVVFYGSITVPSENDSENPIIIQLSGGSGGTDLLPSIEQENVANVSNTSLIDSMSAAAKHNYLVSGTSLDKSVTIKPYIGDVINTDSSLYPSGIMPGVSTVNVDFSIGEDDRIDFQLRTSSFTVEDEDNQKHNSMYYRIGIYPLGDNTVDDIKEFLITDTQHNDGRRLVTGMTGTTYDNKVFYLVDSFNSAADTFYVESIFDHGAAYNFPSKAIFPYRGTYISEYDAILYMQLCNSDGTPSDSIGVINGIEVSLDGETWNTAEYTGDTNMAALDIVELTEENKASFIPVSVN